MQTNASGPPKNAALHRAWPAASRGDQARGAAAGKGAVAVDIAGRGRQHRRHFGLILHVRGGDLDGIEQARILTGRDVPL